MTFRSKRGPSACLCATKLGGSLGLHPPDPGWQRYGSPVSPGSERGRRLPCCHGRQVSVRSELPAVRVFLVDEQEVVRRGVAKMLEGDTELGVVGEAGSVSEALRRASAVRPDVAVVAMPLSDGSGAHVCERLQALVPGVRCLMLSESTTDETVHAAMRAGASGYLDKHVTGPVLLVLQRHLGGDLSGGVVAAAGAGLVSAAPV
jgi:CheY-like chemotaxis protein